jgi:cold shock protein
MIGTVKWFDAAKSFGFIIQPDGTELFVHAACFAPGVTALLAGDLVKFERGVDNRTRRAIAQNVSLAVPALDRIRLMSDLRRSLDRDLVGRPGANEVLAEMRFALAELEQIAAATR